MSVFKCKMCGGTLEFNEGDTVAVCDSCGSRQTLPKSNDDVAANLFNRANSLRLKCEFDKASEIYEKIIEQDASEAEAYWGLVLCKYGIEYVEDPKTHERIPTCHRTSFEAVTADADYISAIKYSDISQKSIYEAEAREIDRIQKDILAIVRNEKPFDVFICYKETDSNGKRTVDSTIANDIYYQLTGEGYKTFFAAITLEDKLGQEFEPYIFAALTSAKVMLVLGTKPENFEAVWVKNEWSRFMKLMKTDRSKMLIPCYRDMDAYELPEEFAHLQAQDMGKIGFINDVIRGIKKVLSSANAEPVARSVGNSSESNSVSPLLKRAFMMIEEGNWNKADELLEQVLNSEPENASAYLGKLLIELQLNTPEDLKNSEQPFDESDNYTKAVRFGDDNLKAQVIEYNNEQLYNQACQKIDEINKKITVSDVQLAMSEFEKIKDWKDSAEKIELCKAKIEQLNKKHEEDVKAAKKRARKIGIFTAAAALVVVFIVLLNSVIIPNLKLSKQYELLKDCQIGDVVKFGVYPQSDAGNKKDEEIEWQVLDVKDGKALLISKRCIDNKPYNEEYEDVTWETCTLRKWLNNDFMDKAFGTTLVKYICKTDLENPDNPEYDTSGGNNTC